MCVAQGWLSAQPDVWPSFRMMARTATCATGSKQTLKLNKVCLLPCVLVAVRTGIDSVHPAGYIVKVASIEGPTLLWPRHSVINEPITN